MAKEKQWRGREESERNALLVWSADHILLLIGSGVSDCPPAKALASSFQQSIHSPVWYCLFQKYKLFDPWNYIKGSATNCDGLSFSAFSGVAVILIFDWFLRLICLYIVALLIFTSSRSVMHVEWSDMVCTVCSFQSRAFWIYSSSHIHVQLVPCSNKVCNLLIDSSGHICPQDIFYTGQCFLSFLSTRRTVYCNTSYIWSCLLVRWAYEPHWGSLATEPGPTQVGFYLSNSNATLWHVCCWTEK